MCEILSTVLSTQNVYETLVRWVLYLDEYQESRRGELCEILSTVLSRRMYMKHYFGGCYILTSIRKAGENVYETLVHWGDGDAQSTAALPLIVFTISLSTSLFAGAAISFHPGTATVWSIPAMYAARPSRDHTIPPTDLQSIPAMYAEVVRTRGSLALMSVECEQGIIQGPQGIRGPSLALAQAAVSHGGFGHAVNEIRT
ncbi:hypothetical protein J6590_005696 [Homalodisca vitripennis]|nr:hypothetical protein J6590_005696 [Homalodisca vitripennis]